MFGADAKMMGRQVVVKVPEPALRLDQDIASSVMARRRSSRGVGEGASSPALRPIAEAALREEVAVSQRSIWPAFACSGETSLADPLPSICRSLFWRAFSPIACRRMLTGISPTPSAGRSRASALGARAAADKEAGRAGHGRLCDGSNRAPSWFANGMAVSTASWRWRKGFAWDGKASAASPRSRGRSPAGALERAEVLRAHRIQADGARGRSDRVH